MQMIISRVIFWQQEYIVYVLYTLHATHQKILRHVSQEIQSFNPAELTNVIRMIVVLL